jgi:hypothetical protein
MESSLVRLGRWARRNQAILAATACVAVLFWVLLGRRYYQDLNYTFVIGQALLHGSLGTSYAPVWLNELVPAGRGLYYSVFPLGAVLSVLPASMAVALGIVPDYPVNLVIVAIAAATFWLSYSITELRPGFSTAKRLMLASWLVLGSWYFTNLLFAGAWQIALGFTVVGELGAIYFSTVKRRPFWAGVMLALAFGNRTEALLTAPVILAFLLRPHWHGPGKLRAFWQASRGDVLKVAVVPVLLLAATGFYNSARFGSPSDYGYARIPGVLSEPWYRHGIFSLYAIPGNIYAMLLQGWHVLGRWPYLVPEGFGGSIVLASPFLLLLLRRPRGNRLRYTGALCALAFETLALCVHGNTGGWQFSYRYGMVLLPWFLLLLVEWTGDRVRPLEVALLVLSLAISGWATWLFMWTSYVH